MIVSIQGRAFALPNAAVQVEDDLFRGPRPAYCMAHWGGVRNLESWSRVFLPTVEELVEAVRDLRYTPFRPMYIHCCEGKDRTGIAVAAYRYAVQKWPVSDALNEMRSLGFHRVRYAHWLWAAPKLLRDVAEALP